MTRTAVRYWRPWLTYTWIAAFGVVPFATGLWGLLYAWGIVGARGSPDRWGVGFAVAWSMVGVIAGVRSAMVSVVATPGSLIIRNFTSTRKIRWTDIRTVERPRPFRKGGLLTGLDNLRNGLRIQLLDGSTRTAIMYSPSGFDDPDFADHVIDDLRRYVNRAKRRRR